MLVRIMQQVYVWILHVLSFLFGIDFYFDNFGNIVKRSKKTVLVLAPIVAIVFVISMIFIISGTSIIFTCHSQKLLLITNHETFATLTVAVFDYLNTFNKIIQNSPLSSYAKAFSFESTVVLQLHFICIFISAVNRV